MLRSACCKSTHRGTQDFTVASHKLGTVSLYLIIFVASSLWEVDTVPVDDQRGDVCLAQLSKRRHVQRELACTEAMTAVTQTGKQSVGYNKVCPVLRELNKCKLST